MNRPRIKHLSLQQLRVFNAYCIQGLRADRAAKSLGLSDSAIRAHLYYLSKMVKRPLVNGYQEDLLRQLTPAGRKLKICASSVVNAIDYFLNETVH